MTADHTPERLSAEEQLAPLTWLDWRILRQAALKWAEQVQHGEPGPEPLLGEVKRILAAHLADVEARLAAVEALADEAHEAPIDLIHEQCPAGGVGPGRECTACSAAGRAYLIGVEHVQRDTLAALNLAPRATP